MTFAGPVMVDEIMDAWMINGNNIVIRLSSSQSLWISEINLTELMPFTQIVEESVGSPVRSSIVAVYESFIMIGDRSNDQVDLYVYNVSLGGLGASKVNTGFWTGYDNKLVNIIGTDSFGENEGLVLGATSNRVYLFSMDRGDETVAFKELQVPPANVTISKLFLGTNGRLWIQDDQNNQLFFYNKDHSYEYGYNSGDSSIHSFNYSVGQTDLPFTGLSIVQKSENGLGILLNSDQGIYWMYEIDAYNREWSIVPFQLSGFDMIVRMDLF